MSKNEAIPQGTTHVWTYAITDSEIRGLFWHITRLAYYKQVEGEWWVYSSLTDWRKSGNTLEWFEEETKEGFFVTVEEYLGS